MIFCNNREDCSEEEKNLFSSWFVADPSSLRVLSSVPSSSLFVSLALRNVNWQEWWQRELRDHGL